MDTFFNTTKFDCESGEPMAKRSKITIDEEEPIDLMGFPGSMDMLFLIVEKMTLHDYIAFVMSSTRMFNICVNSASVKKEFPIYTCNVEIVDDKITFKFPGFEKLNHLKILETMKNLRIKVWIKDLNIKSTFNKSRLLGLSNLLTYFNINDIRSFNVMEEQECWEELPSFLKKFSIREVQMVNSEMVYNYVIKGVAMPKNNLEEYFFGSENVQLNRFSCYEVADEDLILNSEIPNLKIFNNRISASLLEAVFEKFTTCGFMKNWTFKSVKRMPELSQLIDPEDVLDFNYDGPLPDLRPLFVQGTAPTSPYNRETIFVYRKDGQVIVIRRNKRWCSFAPLSQVDNVVVPKVLTNIL